MARLSLPAVLALAEEVRHQVSTRPSVVAGAGAAVIDVCQRHLKRDLLRAAAHVHAIHPFIKCGSGAVGLF